MKLNFRKYGSGHPLFILHGIFGSLDNWYTLGKEFAEQFSVYLIDLRNHGNSPHSEEMNYNAMAEDISELMADEILDSVFLMGHSMGGKVAMNFATSYPEKVDKLIVVDISPRAYLPHHQQIFEGFHSVDLNSLQSRKAADEQMNKKIPEFGVRQFLLKNLIRDNDNNFAWKVNLGVLEKKIDQIGESLSAGAVYSGSTMFIGGSKSKYIQNEDLYLIKRHFPNAMIEMVEGSGHWVHAEKPRELAKLVFDFLS